MVVWTMENQQTEFYKGWWFYEIFYIKFDALVSLMHVLIW
jgi:hypothetical protein